MLGVHRNTSPKSRFRRRGTKTTSKSTRKLNKFLLLSTRTNQKEQTKMNPPHSSTYFSSNNLNNPATSNFTNVQHHASNQHLPHSHTRFSSIPASHKHQSKEPVKPYPRTDFSFLNNQPAQHHSKPAPNIYGTNNASYLSKMKQLSLSQQQPQQKAESYQSDREKFFAEYIRNNGDAATQIIPNFLYIGGHRSVNNVASLVGDKVTHVLNMAGELSLDFGEMEKCQIRLLNVLAKDSKIYNIRKDFDLAFQFIDDCLRSRGRTIK